MSDSPSPLPPGAVAEPPARRKYFRVLTPNPEFIGQRYGYEFLAGECILPEDAVTYLRKGQNTEPVPEPVLPLFADDLHYTVEEIPEGEDPLPRATQARLHGAAR